MPLPCEETSQILSFDLLECSSVPRGGCGASQTWKALKFGSAAPVRVLCLSCFSSIMLSHFVQLFLSLTGREMDFCL